MKFKHVFIIFGIILALIVVGSIFDFQIAQSLYCGDNPFSSLVFILGEYPAYGGLALFGGTIVFTSPKYIKHSFLKFCFVTGGILYLLGAGYMFGKSCISECFIVKYIDLFTKIYVYLPLGILLVSPMFILGYILGKKIDSLHSYKTVVALSFAVAASILLIYGIKIVIDRPRYVLVNELNDATLFRNWWEPLKNKDYYVSSLEIKKDLFDSFPSGHAGLSACLMLILPYLYVYNKNLKDKFTLFLYLSFAISLIVSLSRLLCGYHYLSDTCFAILVTTIVFLIVSIIISKMNKVENK